jgi:hypothetical protein
MGNSLQSWEKKMYGVWLFLIVFTIWASVDRTPTPIPSTPSYDEIIKDRVRSGQLSRFQLEKGFPEFAKRYPNVGGTPTYRRVHNPIKLGDYPDYYNPEAGHWEEFIEDLDNQGISPWDPDAEEMYDLNYGR